jgi:hypothetical protein
MDVKKIHQQAIQAMKDVAREMHTLSLSIVDDNMYEGIRNATLNGNECNRILPALKQRAQLLVDLPETLSNILKAINTVTKKEILKKTENFSKIAKEAIEGNFPFTLITLLLDRDEDRGALNELEKFIMLLNGE